MVKIWNYNTIILKYKIAIYWLSENPRRVI